MNRIRNVPWGLLGMVVLVAAVERLAVRENLDFVGQVAASWRIAGQSARRAAPTCKILFFGDSMVKSGLVPRLVNRATGLRSYNLALQSGPAPASYFMLRRALAEGARPSAVVVDFAAHILNEGPASTVRPYPWAEFLSPREGVELARSARDPDLLASILLGRLLGSYQGRFEIRASILAALSGRSSGQRVDTAMFLRNWGRNVGAQLNYKNPWFREGPPPPPGAAPSPSEWCCDPVNAHYVRKFLALAAARGITVYWLLPPYSPRNQVLFERSGLDARYSAFVREIAAGATNLVVVDARHAGYGASVFYDGAHLDREGALALSAGLAEILRSAPVRPSGGTRWVALPPFRGQETDIALEDLGDSRQAVKDADAALRR